MTISHIPVKVVIELLVDIPREGIYANESQDHLIRSVMSDLTHELRKFLDEDFISDSGRVQLRLIHLEENP